MQLTQIDNRNMSRSVLSENLAQQSGGSGYGAVANGLFQCDSDYEVEWKVASYTYGDGARVGIGAERNSGLEWQSCAIEVQNGKYIDYGSDSGSLNKISMTLNVGDIIKLKVISNTLSIYHNDSLLRSVSLPWLHSPICLIFQGWGNSGTIGLSDFKVKPL